MKKFLVFANLDGDPDILLGQFSSASEAERDCISQLDPGTEYWLVEAVDFYREVVDD